MNDEIEEVKTIYSSQGMTQEEAEDHLRNDPSWRLDGGAFLKQREYSEAFLREIWHNWDHEICKRKKLSLDFIREFHQDSCFDWSNIMANVGFYTEEELERFKQEFHLVQSKMVIQSSFSYVNLVNYFWHETR